MSITLNPGGGPEALSSAAVKLLVQAGTAATPGFGTITANQIAGVADQGEVSIEFVGEVGTLYVRFKSNYATEGKDVSGGFPITIATDPAITSYSAQSAPSLVNGTAYTVMVYWESEDTLTLLPTGNDVEVSNEFTISASVPAPTSISPTSVNVTQGTASGTAILTLVSDVTGAVFSEGTPDLALAAIAAGGIVTLSANADTLGGFVLKAIATTDGGSKAQDVTISVVEGSGGGSEEIEADVTVSTKTALLAQLDAWEADWAGTIPAGKVAGDDRVLALDTSITGGLDLTGYAFDTAGRAGVVIRGAGTFTQTEASVKITGQVAMVSCSGLTIKLFEVVNGQRAFKCENTVDCAIDRCSIKGTANPSTTVSPSKSNYGVHLTISNNLMTVKNCHFQYFGIGLLIYGSTVDFIYEGNTMDLCAHDMLHISGGPHTDMKRNWNGYFGRIFESTAHEDFMQFREGTMLGSSEIAYNLHMERARLNGASPGTHQGFFHGSGSIVNNPHVYQNLSTASKAGTIFNGVSGANVHHNTALMVNTVFSPGYQQWASGTDYNVKCKANTGSSPGGTGPNGLSIVVGDPTDLTVQETYYTGPFSLAGMVGTLLPVAGQRTHWADADPVGCYDLLDKIFNGEFRWEEQGWPTAYPCRTLCNSDAAVSSSYTGTFDADGNNV